VELCDHRIRVWDDRAGPGETQYRHVHLRPYITVIIALDSTGAAESLTATVHPFRISVALPSDPHDPRCYDGVDHGGGTELAGTSTMLALGTEAPHFALPDVTSGGTVRRSDLDDRKALVVMFICRHCPYVRHVRKGLVDLGRDYRDRDVGIVAISANDPAAYPEDAPESLAEEAREAGYTFPYLFDETQEVAKAYTAACTPDFFLFDADRKLAYRGQFDSSRPGDDVPVTGKDIRAAIDAVLADRPVPQDQRPSVGCTIKWRPGNEPSYAR
jgi:peroxiredoxin